MLLLNGFLGAIHHLAAKRRKISITEMRDDSVLHCGTIDWNKFLMLIL